MPTKRHSALKSLEVRLRTSFGRDLSTPAGRRAAWAHFHLFDHAFLRTVWSNFDQVAEGVYRANQPGPKRLEKWKAMGIRGVLNLRGADGLSPWLFEEEACERLGLDLRVAKIYARRPARSAEILRLIETMRAMPRPFVMHCKSGADRAGFAAVLYLTIVEKVPVEQAMRHLHWRYLHLKSTPTGICDHVVELYAARNRAGPIPMEDWFATEYDPHAAAESFAARRRR